MPRRPSRRFPFALAHDLKGGSGLARSEARLFTSIWKDEDFLALPRGAQWLYMFLLSQDDLTYCGVLPLRVPRWARKADGLTAAEIREDLATLAAGPRPFVVTDEETGELLIRSLIRHDGVWKMPNIMKAARDSAGAVESPAIRAVLLAELERLPVAGSESRAARAVHADFVADLRKGCGNPSPNPSGKDHPDPDPEAGYPQAGDGGAAENGPDEPADVNEDVPEFAQATGSFNPSPNPSGNPSPDPSQGKGDGCSPVLQVVPNPFPPPPSPRGGGTKPLIPHGLPSLKTEEGEESEPGRTPEAIAALVAEIRAVRKDWAADSVRRAIDDRAVRDRPWSLVRPAFLAVARDPASKQPGRLGRDGPWWAEAARKVHAVTSGAQPGGHEYDHDPGTGLCRCKAPKVDKAHRRRRTA
jgi:hypothetical protein